MLFVEYKARLINNDSQDVDSQAPECRLIGFRLGLFPHSRYSLFSCTLVLANGKTVLHTKSIPRAIFSGLQEVSRAEGYKDGSPPLRFSRVCTGNIALSKVLAQVMYHVSHMPLYRYASANKLLLAVIRLSA